MKCPVCKHHYLERVALESDLRAFVCRKCGGNWLRYSEYWKWVERTEEDGEKTSDDPSLTISDHQQAKICPECGRIMLRYRIGRGIEFLIDQCGSCNGCWLDENEWSALRSRNLHREIHSIFTSHWQQQAQREEARMRIDRIYSERFKDDYADIKRIKAWLDAHPEREIIIAFLSDSDPYSV